MLSAFSSSPSLVHGEYGEEMDEEDALNGLPVGQCVCVTSVITIVALSAKVI